MLKETSKKKLAANIKSDSKSFFAYVRNQSRAPVKTGALETGNGGK
jgi:hypothetical protein